MATRDEYVDSIKSAFITIGKEGVASALFIWLPFLNIPILREIVRFAIELVITKLVNLTEMEIFFVYIDFRTAQQRESFESAARANWIAQQTGSDEEKKNAETVLINSFRVFARFNS